MAAFHIIETPGSPHEEYVTDAVRDVWAGPIETIDADRFGDGEVGFFDLLSAPESYPTSSAGVNMSWEFTSPSFDRVNPWSPYNGDEHGHYAPNPMDDNIPLTVAAGNGRDNADDPIGVNYLASGPEVFAIGATDGNGNLADFSEIGNGAQIEFLADGTVDGAASMSFDSTATADAVSTAPGTSFAAPRIGAGFAELMKNQGFSLYEAHTWMEMNGDYIDHPNSRGDLVRPNLNQIDSFTTKEEIGTRELFDAAYAVGMGREADEEGLDFWTNEAKEHTFEGALSAFADGSVEIGEDDQVQVSPFERVKAHYHLFLEREPDDAGFDYWMNTIEQGTYGDPGAGNLESSERNINWDEFTRTFIESLENLPETGQNVDPMDPFFYG